MTEQTKNISVIAQKNWSMTEKKAGLPVHPTTKYRQ